MTSESERKICKLVAALLGGVESFSAQKAVRALAQLAESSAGAALIRQTGGEARLEVMAAGAAEPTAGLARTALALIDGTSGPRVARQPLAPSSSYGQRPESWPAKPRGKEQRNRLATIGDYMATAKLVPSPRKAGRGSTAALAAAAQEGVFAVGVSPGAKDHSPAPLVEQVAGARADRFAAPAMPVPGRLSRPHWPRRS